MPAYRLSLKNLTAAISVFGAVACSAEQPGARLDALEATEAYVLPKLESDVKTGLESRAEIQGCLEFAPELFTENQREALVMFSDYTGFEIQDSIDDIVAKAPEGMGLNVWNYSMGYLKGNVTASRVYTNETCLGLKEIFPADFEFDAEDAMTLPPED